MSSFVAGRFVLGKPRIAPDHLSIRLKTYARRLRCHCINADELPLGAVGGKGSCFRSTSNQCQSVRVFLPACKSVPIRRHRSEDYCWSLWATWRDGTPSLVIFSPSLVRPIGLDVSVVGITIFGAEQPICSTAVFSTPPPTVHPVLVVETVSLRGATHHNVLKNDPLQVTLMSTCCQAAPPVP